MSQPEDKPSAQEAGTPEMPVGIGRALIARELGAARGLPDFDAAKAGSYEAAAKLAHALIGRDFLDAVATLAGPHQPIIQAVHAIESTGHNAIPGACAKFIAKRVGLDVGISIMQLTSPRRSAMEGLERLFNRPRFDGSVEPGRAYLLVDDTITQGGTFAALERHIRNGGAYVIGALALTGKHYSAQLALQHATLDKLRSKHGDLDQRFREQAGHGFAELTESEARFLASFKPAHAVRTRILAGTGASGLRTAGQAGLTELSGAAGTHSDQGASQEAQRAAEALNMLASLPTDAAPGPTSAGHLRKS